MLLIIINCYIFFIWSITKNILRFRNYSYYGKASLLTYSLSFAISHVLTLKKAPLSIGFVSIHWLLARHILLHMSINIEELYFCLKQNMSPANMNISWFVHQARTENERTKNWQKYIYIFLNFVKNIAFPYTFMGNTFLSLEIQSNIG